jgi:hypothetical protein
LAVTRQSVGQRLALRGTRTGLLGRAAAFGALQQMGKQIFQARKTQPLTRPRFLQ